MGQSLNNIKRRINSINSTRKITSSMKLVSSVKSRKFLKELDRQKEYSSALRVLIFDALASNGNFENIENQLFKGNPNGNNLYIIVTSSLGLCGSYNNEIYRFYNNIFKEGDEVLIIGEKGYHEFKKHANIKLHDQFVKYGDKLDYDAVEQIAHYIIDLFNSGNYLSAKILYHEYINTIASKVKCENLLPLIVDEKDKKGNIEHIYLADRDSVINYLIPKYLTGIIYARFNSSLVSEHSTRRNAMDNADKNAKEIVDKLKLEYNKARQQAITQEITEVIAGSKGK